LRRKTRPDRQTDEMIESNGITTPPAAAVSVDCSEEVSVESTPCPATVGFSTGGRP
jgi:hypothetical protein